MPGHHWFAPYNRRRKKRKLGLNHVRPDGPAFAEIQAALYELDSHYGGLLPNSPPSEDELRRHSGPPPLLPNDGSLGRGDLVVMVGKPGLDEERQNDTIRIERGFTTLENKVEDILREYFEVLARSHIRLQRPYANQLRKPYGNRSDTTFTEYGQYAWYKECKTLEGTDVQKFDAKDRRTAAYVLNLPEIPTLRGADLLLAFGVSGNHTLALACRLRADLIHLLREPNFTILEISNAVQPERPTNLRFVSDWTFEIILQARPRVPADRAV